MWWPIGVDIHTHIFHKQDDGSYEELKLYIYNKNGNGAYTDISDYMPYNDRNYMLFDALALAGRGFAHIEEPIVPQRGPFPLAPDAEEFQKEYEYCYNYTYFDWCEISDIADSPKAEMIDWDMVVELEYTSVENYPYINILRPWLHDINSVLFCYGIFNPKPGDIVIQVSFDS